MNFAIEHEDEEFRNDVRSFLTSALPSEMSGRVRRSLRATREDTLAWTGILSRKGWSVPSWPKEEGGTDWSAVQRYIFEEECCAAFAPNMNEMGTLLVGPVICAFGSQEQKRRFLHPIRTGETFWCQGFSEPNAGSDLAALTTSAIKTTDGRSYRVNGQKIWTSEAQFADWIFMLVRTDMAAKAQRSISFLLVNMRSPGITVRPLLSIDGHRHLNEVFFDDVEVPIENLVGEENKGWGYTKFLLGNERAFAAPNVPLIKSYATRLRELATTRYVDGQPLILDLDFCRRLAEVEIEVSAIEMSVMRIIQGTAHGSTPALSVGSILKVRGAELQQNLTTLMVEALGAHGAVSPVPELGRMDSACDDDVDFASGIVANALYRRAAGIFGGTNEIQREIIAKHALGL